MDLTIQKFRNFLERKKGTRDALLSQKASAKKTLENLKIEIEDAQDAKTLIQIAAKMTQQELEYQISELVTLGNISVFGQRAYSFWLDFVERRNRTEADFSFSRGDGPKTHPFNTAGGGAVDVSAYSLRLGVMNLIRPRVRRTLGLDEPFRFVSRDLQSKASALAKDTSSELKMQIIMISHSQDLINSADRVFKVTIEKGISHVEGDQQERNIWRRLQ